ncbi:MAG: hypothetical protein U0271_28420 [Polyangiaceae bacterium]
MVGYFEQQPETEPSAVKWGRFFAWALAALYVFCVLGGVLILLFLPNPWKPVNNQMPPGVTAIILIVVGIPAIIMSLLAARMNRTSGTWTLNLVLQALAMTSCCCMPLAIPLLIQWLKPETKKWFNA